MGRIDCYTHFTFAPLLDYVTEQTGYPHELATLFASVPSLWDVDERLRLMDDAGVDHHVLVPVPVVPGPLSGRQAATAARLCNELLSEVVHKHGDRFSAAAMVPVDSPTVMASELELAKRELGLLGAALGIGPQLRPPDSPHYTDLYAAAEELGAPLWLHPARTPRSADYVSEPTSRHGLWQSFGWIFDDTSAMVRIALSGTFDRHPDLKIIVHHAGGMVPMFTDRLEQGLRFFKECAGVDPGCAVRPPYADQLRKFYVDTATHGVNPLLVRSAVDFFGVDRVLFGSDAPMDADNGRTFASAAAESIESAGLSGEEQQLVFQDNFLRLLSQHPSTSQPAGSAPPARTH